MVQVNEFVKRVRAFRIHLLIIGHIKHAMPALFGKDKAARKMLQQLPEIFRQVRVAQCLSKPNSHNVRSICAGPADGLLCLAQDCAHPFSAFAVCVHLRCWYVPTTSHCFLS